MIQQQNVLIFQKDSIKIIHLNMIKHEEWNYRNGHVYNTLLKQGVSALVNDVEDHIAGHGKKLYWVMCIDFI